MMGDSYDKFLDLQLQAVEPSPEMVQSPPLTDVAARLAILLSDDPTDPDTVGIRSYLEVARRH